MPTTSGAVLEKLSPAQPTATVQPRLALWREKDSSSKVAAKRKKIISERDTKPSNVAASGLPQTKPRNGVGSNGHNALHALEDVTSAAAEAAKDYRSWMFEHMKSNVNAALGYASGLATMGLSTHLDAFSVSRKREQRIDPSISKPEKHISAPDKVTAEFCAKAFEFMTANVTATLEYAQRLSDVKSPSEFVELSTGHARKQVELAMTHTAALRALSQTPALTNAKRSKPLI